MSLNYSEKSKYRYQLLRNTFTVERQHKAELSSQIQSENVHLYTIQEATHYMSYRWRFHNYRVILQGRIQVGQRGAFVSSALGEAVPPWQTSGKLCNLELTPSGRLRGVVINSGSTVCGKIHINDNKNSCVSVMYTKELALSILFVPLREKSWKSPLPTSVTKLQKSDVILKKKNT